MLDKQSRRVLKIILSFPLSQNGLTATQLFKSAKNKRYKYSLDEIIVNIRYLSKHKYITASTNTVAYYELKPTVEGMKYFAIKKVEFLNFLCKSIFLPIGVSAVTTLLALLIKYLITGSI